MKKIKKVLVGLLACLTVGCTAVGLSACGDEEGKKPANDGETVWTIDTVYATAKDLGYEGSLEEFLATVKGAQGEKGLQGEQGVGIKEIKLNKLGELVIALTNGTETNLGKIAGQVSIENPEEFDFYLMDDGTYGVKAGNACYLKELTIPSMYKGKKVTKILDCFFGEYPYYVKTQKLTIPDTVTSIENRAFWCCESLTSIEIPDSVTSIGKSAFETCGGLTSIEIPKGVTSIGENAFYYCRSLTSIEVDKENTAYQSIDGNLYSKDGKTLIQYAIGKTAISFTITNSVTSIGERAFIGCSSLTSIEIPNGVTSIGERAFSGCSGLTSITIPNSVTSIGVSAFSDCDSLTSVTIGNGVTSIGESAFSNFDSLTSVTIGNGVTSIGDWAFGSCSGLTSITFNGTVAEWNEIEKGYYWNFGVPATKVVCTDGEIEVR